MEAVLKSKEFSFDFNQDYSSCADVEVLADSIFQGVRLTTFCITMPKALLAELNTHRVFSRNAASSRAISPNRYSQEVPVWQPAHWTKEEKGMFGKHELEGVQLMLAKIISKSSYFFAKLHANLLYSIGLHKQYSSRHVDSFHLVKVIVSSTDFKNFIMLRSNKSAQPELQIIAGLIQLHLLNSRPTILNDGDWHIPFARFYESFNDISLEEKLLAAAGRIARVSYLNDKTIEEDVALGKRLIAMKHMSPFEHIAKASSENAINKQFVSNFDPAFIQYRSYLS